MNTTYPTVNRPVRPENPRNYWRALCWVTPRIALCGDLPTDRTEALAQLAHWEANGITHEIDVRVEANDAAFVEANSAITYIWHGVDDDGGRRDDTWFDAVVGEITAILTRDPEARIVVHCHLGVNRAPSIVYAALLALGWDDLDALRRIRDERPIAGIIYATDAVRWHGRRNGHDAAEIARRLGEVRAWFERNRLDLGWVIRNIHRRMA
ncbi:MAG: hypothetical protein EBT97_03105 [Actinobacteria bacterium]|nr:hypothetical protein [Actinomycetota bacterium]